MVRKARLTLTKDKPNVKPKGGNTKSYKAVEDDMMQCCNLFGIILSILSAGKGAEKKGRGFRWLWKKMKNSII